ncbi:cysteine/O-acetylserine transporter [Dickeya fangzhongdai]|uniref:cysteine/O-acetylserine transporter n=1 Tax=Dickeya fangzhongdai TaxID=1778540 RepID=UPI002B2A9225|nr:cysteine/O-acetylserine transporter [Dickeya fangzhongdai]
MTPAIITAFFTYTFITALTPGPNNILALSTVNQYGIRRSSGVLVGMCVGFLIIMLLCAAFTLTLIRILPAVSNWLTWAGAAYILWLAWVIATSDVSSTGADTKPLSFWASFSLQFINVKIILYGITALSTFVLPYTQDLFWVLSVSLLLTAIGCIGNWCWALAGHLFQSVFQRHGRIINFILSAMLVYCAVRMFI